MGNKLSINIFTSKGVTHFSGFKLLLFPHCGQFLVLLSFQVSTSIIRRQLHKDLIGIQHRPGGINLFWGRRRNGQEPQTGSVVGRRRICFLSGWFSLGRTPHTHHHLAACLPLPRFLITLAVPNATLTLCAPWSNRCCSEEKEEKAGVIIFFLFFFFNLSFFSSEITYKW